MLPPRAPRFLDNTKPQLFSCPESPAPSINRNTLRCVRSPDHRCDDPQPPPRCLRGGLCAGAVAMTVA
eukprot:6576198-Prymnesium_polylepis.1